MIEFMEPTEGIEPPTYGLRNRWRGVVKPLIRLPFLRWPVTKSPYFL